MVSKGNIKLFGVLFLILFIGSLFSGVIFTNFNQTRQKSPMNFDQNPISPLNGFINPPQIVQQTEFTYRGENSTEALPSFNGGAVVESDTDQDFAIKTNQWNISDISLNFTDVRVEQGPLSVEETIPPSGFYTIFNMSGGSIINLLAMQLVVPNDCFIFKLKVYLRYAGNFSIDMRLLRTASGVVPPAPDQITNGYDAISNPVNLTTTGSENRTEWVEFTFSPKTLKAYLDTGETDLNSFFAMIYTDTLQEIGSSAFLQWGYQLDSVNGDDGKAYVLLGNLWQLITIDGEEIDLLLKDIMISTITWTDSFDVESDDPDNFVLVYEEETGVGAPILKDNAMQFQTDSISFLTQLEVEIKYRGQVYVWADIYNATESTESNPGKPIPDTVLFSSTQKSLYRLTERDEWITLKFPALDASDPSTLNLYSTYDQTFFVVLQARGGGVLSREYVYWGYVFDSTNGDDGLAYYKEIGFGGEEWILYENDPGVGQNIDFTLKNIELVTYELNPSTVGLQVNGTPVIDYTTHNFGGSVLFSGLFDGGAGKIQFDVTANQKIYFSVLWTALFTNKTKAKTIFIGKSLKSIISWNITLNTNYPLWNSSGVNVGLYYRWEVNISTPMDYSISKVRYKGLNLPENVFWKTEVKGTQQILLIRNITIILINHGFAGLWEIEATSPNYVEDIRTYNGTERVQYFYVGDLMNVTAKLKSPTTQPVNLSIYNLNKQRINTSKRLPIGLWVTFPLWQILENGTHHVVVLWSNGTEVGIKSLSLMCNYHTNLSVVYTNIGSQPFAPTDNIYVDVFYNDTDNNAGISSATIDVNVSFLVSEHTTAGYYNITIQPFLLPNGNYTARISAYRAGYNRSIVFVRFRIFSTANATLSAVEGIRTVNSTWWIDPEPYFDDQTHILTVFYANGTSPYEGISYAQVVAAPNWTSSMWFGSPTNLTPGFYDIHIDTFGLHEGDVGEITITAYSEKFETKVIQVYLNITEIPSSLLYIDPGQYSNITAYEGETIKVAVGYWDDFHEKPIVFANTTEGYLTWQIQGTNESGILEKSVWQYETSISLPEHGIFGTKIYILTITAIAARDYATTTTNLTLNVLSKENTTLLLTNWTATEYRIGNSFSVFANLTFTENGTALVNKRIDFQIRIFNETGGLLDFFIDSRNTNATGIAKYDFPTILNPKIRLITVNASFIGSESIDSVNATLIIPIKPKYNVTLMIISSFPTEILVGNSLEIEARLLNNETGQGIENATIIFNLIYGIGQRLTQTATTNAQGIAYATILITNEMESYDTITVQVEFEGTGTTSGTKYTAPVSIAILTTTKLIMRYMPWVIMAVALAVVAYVSYRKLVVAPRLRRRFARMQKMASKFSDIINLQHLLVVHSDSGSCIYQYSFGEIGLDADLISGFLTAIAAFQTEIKAAPPKISFGERTVETETRRGFELSYADFKILLEDGEKIRTALILATTPSESIRNSLNDFVIEFENMFKKELVSWKGAIAPFKKADELIEKIFETSLLWPHRIEKMEREIIKDLNSLESGLFTLALDIQTEKQYFFLPALVAKAEKIRRESQVELLGTIDDLRQKGIFKPIPIEKLEEQLQQNSENNQTPPKEHTSYT
ncbi:MAG: hypothetical protein ACTSRS_20005 [Candidatus Helarchaeota archaeon]